ncbi:MAG: response regulator [Desulfovibrio sp.]|nr:response regulator [Desulfovibrio sp.]
MAPYTDTVHRFIIDGSAEPGEEGFSPLGSEEPVSGYDKSYFRAYATGTPQFSETTELQHWGSVISTFTPIFNSSGAVVGMIGCDFDVKSIREQVLDHLLWPMIFFFLFLVIGFLLYRRLLNAVMKQNMELETMNQRVLAATKAKSTFLARTSHEIRTPMNAILGLSELARRQPCPPKALEYIEGIGKAGKDLLGVINDILDFAWIESGTPVMHPAPYETASLLQDVQTIARVRAGEKSLELQTDFSPDIPRSPIGDVDRIRQILLNLLNNAVKYTDRGFVKFSAYATPGAGDEIRLTFIVEDSGIGIRAEDMPRLFGEFLRIDEKRNIGIAGTGLGLSIARSLCRAMGGDIAVRSEYGSGSVFTAELTQAVYDRRPMGDITGMAVKRTERRHMGFSAPEAELLVVDDLPANLLVAEGLLARCRARVTTCANGREAVDLVRTRSFDLVLMDHMMPVMDGVEATRAIRALDEERCRTVPIVALTAADTPGIKEMFAANGFNELLCKPVTPDALDAVLRRWIPAAKRVEWLDASGSAAGTAPSAQPPAGGSGQGQPERPEGSGPRQSAAPGRQYGGEIEPSAAPQAELPRRDDEDAAGAELPRIEGVDTALGLMRVGGSRELYLELLAVFRADAEACLARLADEPQASIHPAQTLTERNGQSPDTSLRAFITQVHAVKSALANIGAGELSGTAALLEKAGKEADNLTIRAKLPAFREELAALTGRIGVALAPGTARSEDAGEHDPAVAENLARLHDALERGDIDAVDDALARLQTQPLSENLRSAVNETADCILTAEFTKAADIVGDLLKKQANAQSQQF